MNDPSSMILAVQALRWWNDQPDDKIPLCVGIAIYYFAHLNMIDVSSYSTIDLILKLEDKLNKEVKDE